MLAAERRRVITERIQATGQLVGSALSVEFQVSEETIRRDLERMEQKGLIRRRHGGAESLILLRPPQMIRRQHNPAEKQAVARKAAELVTPGSTTSAFLVVAVSVWSMASR